MAVPDPMTRKHSIILALAALVGAAGLGYLLVLLFAGTGTGQPRREERPRLSARAAKAPGADERMGAGQLGPSGVSTGTPPANARVRRGGGLPARTPYDSPEAIRLRAEQSARVVEILDSMIAEKDARKRWQLNLELKKLLRGLGRRVSPEVRDRLLEMLDSADRPWKALVGDALGELEGDEAVAKALLDRVRARPEDVFTHNAIYAALSKINVPSVAKELLGMLGEGYPDEHLMIRAIGRVGGPKEAGVLLGMLDKTLRPETRREIVAVLKERRNIPGLLDQVARKLESSNPTTRRSAVEILQLSRDPKQADEVRKLLTKETDSGVRADIIRALGKFGDPDSGRTLLRIAESGDPIESRRAMGAIYEIRNPKTLELLADSWPGMGESGRAALLGAADRTGTPSERLEGLARDGLADASRRVRVQAARLLGRRGLDANVEALGAFLARAKHPSEWTAGFEALKKIQTRKAAREALAALRVVPSERKRDDYRRQFESILARAR